MAKVATRIVLDKKTLKKALRELADADADIARALEEAGTPELRDMPTGYGGLMRSIVGQQVSVHAARSIWLRLEAAVPSMEPAAFLAQTDEQLRAVGLSGAKMKYGRSLATDIVEGRIDFSALDDLDDAAAIAMLTQAKGIGPWTAEIYLMFRARPTRHHAGPRSRPGRSRAAPQEAAHAAGRQTAAQDRPKPGVPGAAPLRLCSGTIAATCRTGAPGKRTGRRRSDQTRRPQPRPARRRQARPSRRAAARLWRRRQRPDRAGAPAWPAHARHGVPRAQRAAALRRQSLRLSVVRHLPARSGDRARRGAHSRAAARRLSRRHHGGPMGSTNPGPSWSVSARAP
jgi:DNA-3-methyladenine glycosylase II